MEKIRQSAIVINVFDVKELNRDDLWYDLSRLPSGEIPVVIAGNKIDQGSENQESEFSGVENVLFISAKE